MEKVFSSARRCLWESQCVCVYVCVCLLKGSLCLCCIHINALLPTSKDWRVLLSFCFASCEWTPPPEICTWNWNVKTIILMSVKTKAKLFLCLSFCDSTKRHLFLVPRLLCREQSQWWTVSVPGQRHRDYRLCATQHLSPAAKEQHVGGSGNCL